MTVPVAPFQVCRFKGRQPGRRKVLDINISSWFKCPFQLLLNHNKKWKANYFCVIFIDIDYRRSLVCFQWFFSFDKCVFSIPVSMFVSSLFVFPIRKEPSEQKDRRLAPGPCLLEWEVFRMAPICWACSLIRLGAAALALQTRRGLLVLGGPWTLESRPSCRGGSPSGLLGTTVVWDLSEPPALESTVEGSNQVSALWCHVYALD